MMYELFRRGAIALLTVLVLLSLYSAPAAAQRGIGGTIVVEYVFGARGLAYQIYWSIEATKEYEVVLAATLVFVAVTVLLKLLSEFVALMADPRLRAA